MSEPEGGLRRVERQCADQKFVKDHAERVDVGTGIHIETGHLCLLRAHVLRCPDREAGLRQALAAKRVDLLGLAGLKQAPVPQTVPVPDALAGFVVEKVRATDYDFLLRGGYHE